MSELETLLSYFKPPQRLSGSEWADTYGIIPSNGAQPGKWRSLAWQRGILDALTDPTKQNIVIPKAARIGLTKCLMHLIGYHVHQDPCNIGYYMPDDALAKKWSQEELNPMITETPVLKGLFSEPRRRDAANSTLHKEFPGGLITGDGAGSANNFRAVTRRIMILDDFDGAPIFTSEGDQVMLAGQRIVSYWNGKLILVSSPGEEAVSRTWSYWNKSDKNRFYVPCPECGVMQYLKFSQFRWEKRNPETVTYECESCATRIEPAQKMDMIEAGEWRPTAVCNDYKKWNGYHIWQAYSNAPGSQWPDIVNYFLESKDDPPELQVFVNTVLGEPWRADHATKLEAAAILERREIDMQRAVMPDKALMATIGVDTQDDRLEAFVWAWGHGEEAWLLDHEVCVGDPSIPEGESGSPWNELTKFIQRPLGETKGSGLVAPMTAIDTGGHNAGAVHQFAKDHAQDGVIPIKGGITTNAAVVNSGTAVEYNFLGRTRKSSKLYTINVNAVKTLLFGRMKNCEPGTAGSFHFPGWMDEDFAKQLTIEQKQITQKKHGPREMRWVCPSGKRNEATDGMTYAYAALKMQLRKYDPRHAWQIMEKHKEMRMADQEKPVKSQKKPRYARPLSPF